uniref:Sirtuin 5 n=1 Tax=Sinocyclocheilus anshuiensis TaxID=1608454 RepID=A0A671MWR4_9TELE
MIVRQLTCRGLTSQLCAAVRLNWSAPKMARPSSNLTEFREHFAKAKHIAIITGAGVSAESGVPTFRGQGGYWRKWQAQVHITQFLPSSREVGYTLLTKCKMPNPAHLAIAECESRLSKQGRSVVIITQNIDELHHSAGSKHVYEIHGSLFKTRCMSCGEVKANHKSPICPALEGKGEPDSSSKDARIPVEHLPRCDRSGCNGLLRPHVVWFGETLDSDILTAVEQELEICDLCLVFNPAAMFASQVAGRGVPVAEFNMECTPATNGAFPLYHFEGPCGVTLTPALERHESEAI